MCGEHLQELYTVIVQILNLQNCFSTPNKNLGGEGASDRQSPAAKSLYRSFLKKRRPLGFGVFIIILSMLQAEQQSQSRVKNLTPWEQQRQEQQAEGRFQEEDFDFVLGRDTSFLEGTFPKVNLPFIFSFLYSCFHYRLVILRS